MNILVVAESIAPNTGGGRTGILGLCIGLARRGHRVTLQSIDPTLGSFEAPVREFVDGVSFVFFPLNISILGNWVSIPFLRELHLTVSKSDIVIIHSIYRVISTAAAYFCRISMVPYVLRPHGALDPFLVNRRRKLLKKLYIYMFERRNFKHAAAIQYSSKSEFDLAQQFIAATGRVLIISEGINLKSFDFLPLPGTFSASFPQLVGKKILLYLGRLHQKKGIELLIDAFGTISSRSDDLHLVLIGTGDSSYVAAIKNLVLLKRLESRVSLLGYVSEPEKLACFVDAHIFILPSYGENFGLSVVEAMACRTAVIVSNKVGLFPFVETFKAGLVVDCVSEQLALAITRIIEDENLRICLGNNGARLVAEIFNIERMSEHMELEYSQLLNVT
jgi:glycosyltransferase involved in cell wall biosynthesis